MSKKESSITNSKGVKDDINKLNLSTENAIKNGSLFKKYPLEFICGILVLVNLFCLGTVLLHYSTDMRVMSIAGIVTFSIITVIAICLIKYKKLECRAINENLILEKEIKKEELLIKTIINDFDKEKYIDISIDNSIGIVVEKQVEGKWILFHHNKITKGNTLISKISK